MIITDFRQHIYEYQQQGYFAEFLTNADLGFIGLDHFLNGLGLDSYRGRDDVDEMRTAPRVVQDAPSDAYLYREALQSVRRLFKRKWIRTWWRVRWYYSGL